MVGRTKNIGCLPCHPYAGHSFRGGKETRRKDRTKTKAIKYGNINHTWPHRHTCIYTHTHTHTHMHGGVHTHTHTHTHARTQKNTGTRERNHFSQRDPLNS